MFLKLECVSVPTTDIEASIRFYRGLGLVEGWRIDRRTDAGEPWTLVGLRFPNEQSSELVLSDDPDNHGLEVEILVADVRATYRELAHHAGVEWIRTPFNTESGHVAVMKAPDGNVFVLVGT